MKIATYNILKGGSTREHWVKLVEENGVDLLLVQESYHPDKHFPPLLYPGARKQSAWEMVEQNGWGSAVFTNSGALTPVAVPGFSGWVVGAEITGAEWQVNYADPILAFSLHAPSTIEGYRRQVNKILDAIKLIAVGREVIIGGDFNLTVSHFPAAERPTHKQDLAIQARLADEFGLLNCWQTANAGQPLHQTLRWSRDRAIPFHCDSLFVPLAWMERLALAISPPDTKPVFARPEAIHKFLAFLRF